MTRSNISDCSGNNSFVSYFIYLRLRRESRKDYRRVGENKSRIGL